MNEKVEVRRKNGERIIMPNLFAFATLANIPAFLRALPYWVGWRFVTEGDGKPKKRPFNPRTGLPASVKVLSTTAPFSFLAKANPYTFDGVGFVLVKSLHLVVVDLDHAVDPVTVTIAPWASAIVERFVGLGFIELSPTRTGIHIIGPAELPVGYIRGEGVELFHHRRFITVTGVTVPGVESATL